MPTEPDYAPHEIEAMAIAAHLWLCVIEELKLRIEAEEEDEKAATQ